MDTHKDSQSTGGSRRGLALLLATAAAVRLVVGADLWRGDPLTRALHSDPAYYDAWARALAEGGTFFEGRPFWFPPLYPYALSALYRVTGGAVAATVVAQLVVGLAGTALLVLVARRAVGPRAALAAGWLWTFYAPVVFFETRLLAVNAALPLGLASLLGLVAAESALRRGSGARGSAAAASAFAGGLAAGLAALARPNLLLAGPFAALALVLAGRRGGAGAPRTAVAVLALAAGAALGVAPSAVHNAHGGALIPVSANGGLNFWFGNNEHARGTFRAPAPEWGDIATQRDVSIAIASEATGEPLREARASDWWFARGRRWMAEHPLDAVALWGRKLADSLSSTELGIQYFLSASRTTAPALWIPFLPFGVLLALGVLGLRGAATGRGVLLAWIAAGLAASLLFFTYSRFRLPILVAWMPFAGRGALRLVDLVRGRLAPDELPLGVRALAFVALAQSFVPFEGAYPAQLRANSLVDAGRAAAAQGDAERGRRLIEASLEDVPVNPKARVELGLLGLRAGDERAALREFEAAWAMPGAYPLALLALAQLELTATDETVRAPEAAAARLRSWLASAPATSPFRAEATVLLATGILHYPSLAESADEARRLAESVLRRNPEEPRALAVLRHLDGG